MWYFNLGGGCSVRKYCAEARYFTKMGLLEAVGQGALYRCNEVTCCDNDGIGRSGSRVWKIFMFVENGG